MTHSLGVSHERKVRKQFQLVGWREEGQRTASCPNHNISGELSDSLRGRVYIRRAGWRNGEIIVRRNGVRSAGRNRPRTKDATRWDIGITRGGLFGYDGISREASPYHVSGKLRWRVIPIRAATLTRLVHWLARRGTLCIPKAVYKHRRTQIMSDTLPGREGAIQ